MVPEYVHSEELAPTDLAGVLLVTVGQQVLVHVAPTGEHLATHWASRRFLLVTNQAFPAGLQVFSLHPPHTIQVSPLVVQHNILAVEHLTADLTGKLLVPMFLLVLREVAVGGEESETHLTLERLVICPTVVELQCTLHSECLPTAATAVAVLTVHLIPAVLVGNMLL